MINPNDVQEQQIVISEMEFVQSKIEITEGFIRTKYNIPYSKLPYCYGTIWIGEREDPFAGAHMFLFRDKPLTDSRRRAWHPSPSTANRSHTPTHKGE